MAKKFSKVNIELTNICNLQCSFCPEVLRTKKLMDVELFRHVIKEVAPLAKMVAFHLMGEPLLHPKLPELVEICHEQRVQIFFVSNGVLLGAKQAEILLHPAFRQVNFSLHSYADNFGEAHEGLDAYLERIFQFTEKAFVERPQLFINYRLWNLSHPKGREVQNQKVLQKVEERFGVPLRAAIDNRVKKSVILKNRLSLHFDTEFIWPGIDLPVIGMEGTCYGLSSHFGILVDGTVVPCCLDKEGHIPLGKIQEHPIVDILKSSRAQAMLTGFRQRKLVESLCQRCQYVQRFEEASL